MKLLAVNLLLLMTLLSQPAHAANPAIDAYLKQLTPLIQKQFAGIKMTGRPVLSDIEFTCWGIGGKPTSVEHSSIGNNQQWDQIVTDKISACDFPTFKIKNVSEVRVYARISFFPDSAKPQPEVMFKSYEELRQGPLYRFGEMFFYGGTYICAVPCIVLAVIALLVSVGDLVFNKRSRVAAKNL